ncbi:TetR/AcrR family transcriptional regulator [Streptomyces sp. FH025]|uniref:TetR/AcrR family transcriptional regulator n=1 Tax=Streptomyces sp. FH025 TaxID=2815937 RepID=UPI001A9FC10E|nr:TetR/AcrR family transcriptional regulator [Streptomyces sp. FH025]MBO1418782.1 TetR/AcrR family transcriptional regulator [Streptomyces sp. FH025]
MTSPEATRAKIVEAAADLFARCGVRAVGINEIWRAAGVAKSTLYQHFRSKDEMVAAVLRQRNDQWCARLRALAESREAPTDRVLAVFDLLDNEFADPAYRGGDLVNVAAEYPDPDHPVRMAIRDHKREILRYLAGLAAAAGADAPDKAAALVLMLADGAVCARVGLGDVGVARTAREAAARLLPAGPAGISAP